MNKPDLSQFDAILFDMDGVLVDSEPLWKIAMEEVFTALGSKLTKTDFQKTVGMRIDQVILFWKEIEGWKEQVQYIEYQIIERMVALIREEGQALPGVQDTVMHFNKIKKVGLASSSPKKLIDSVLLKTQLNPFFHGVFSAENEPFGKPHPQVYLNCAMALEQPPSRCICFEDSFNGLISAKSARMLCIAIPAPEFRHQPRFQAADLILNSLEEFDLDLIERLRD
jgi:sugar-phosphatase